ncbi:hypothetical protein PsorP6_011565 [Peronosclerospora sorghi]|uniref:Uncharacterized protein n=1 Tax=Peronosclerospora sorghi TaxID=230839 RepID=A0ACC0WKY6_9STRA|nr:hypothetical protein PsorP6_011565 [Peronosclerospora sorghi]
MLNRYLFSVTRVFKGVGVDILEDSKRSFPKHVPDDDVYNRFVDVELDFRLAAGESGLLFPVLDLELVAARFVLVAEVMYIIVGSKWPGERLDIFGSALLPFFPGGARVWVLSAKVNTEETID